MEANEGTQDGNMYGREDGAGTEMGVKTRGRTQNGNGDGSEDGNEGSRGDGDGDEKGNGDVDEDRIGEGGGEAKKRKKPHKSCRRHVENGQDLGGKRNKRRHESIDSVAADPDNLEIRKEAEGVAKFTQ